MRMEDLDRNRVQPGLADRILDDLIWLGIDWDEGPDLGGPFAPYEQWARRERYSAAFERLRREGLLYPCFCSRKEIAAAASAPQSPGDELRYPGSCRGIDPEAGRRRVESGARHAWRLRVGERERPVFADTVRGSWGTDQSSPPGDFVVFRSDGVPAYQLAVVVDDAEMKIDEVVRGDDLLPSTARQLLLYRALGWEPPVFGHVPLLLGSDGVRLAKRHRGVTLRELRESGFGPEQVVGRLARAVGLRPRPDPVSAADLVDGFALERVPPAPDGIVIDPSRWSSS
jgi:glutamyl-tRNA synthetase